MELGALLVAAFHDMKSGFLYKRIVLPMLELLRQGVSPEKLALSIALGVTVGVFPVLGTTTALCALAALLLRLNLPAIQIANYVVYPVQLALLLPFFRLGEWIFRSPHLPISGSQLNAVFRASRLNALHLLGTTLWHAAVAWLLLAPFAVALLYVLFLIILRRARFASSP